MHFWPVLSVVLNSNEGRFALNRNNMTISTSKWQLLHLVPAIKTTKKIKTVHTFKTTHFSTKNAFFNVHGLINETNSLLRPLSTSTIGDLIIQIWIQ